MKIEVDCTGFDSEADRAAFAADAKKANVKWTYVKKTYCDSIILEGDVKNVKRFVEDHWQTSTTYQTFDELVANDLDVTYLG